MKNISKIVLILAFLGSLSGCHVKYTMTGASISANTKTISVAYFPNRAPLVNPTLSQQLTESLKDKFTSQTSLKMTNGDGDLSFEGEITGYDTKPIAVTGNDQTDKASLNRLTITVKVQFTNQQDPKSNFDTQFTAYEDYDSSKGLDEIEGQLVPVILDKLIEDIFNKSVVNW